MKKTNRTKQIMLQKTDFKPAKEILKPDVIIKSGIKELDKLIGGFKTGQITYIDGDSKLIKDIPNQICVNTYRTFQKDTIYIDAGASTNPYKIAQYAKKMETDQRKTLEHIHISRAFTVYQLTTLIQDQLEPMIKKYHPKTLLIGKFPVFYLDTDVEKKEAQTLLRANIHKTEELTKKYKLITIFTNHDKKMLTKKRDIQKIIHYKADETILMNQTELATKVRLLKNKQETMILHLVAGQLRLQDFGMVI